MQVKNIFKIKLSGIVVEMHSNFDYSEKYCKNYIIDSSAKPDIIAEVSQEQIEESKGALETAFSDGYCESICLYRAIAEKMPIFDRLVFHGAAVEVDGKGYIFTAPSGTGKTTHIGLWFKYFGDRVKIINGDKPILRLESDGVSVCSTPWSGKERFERNTEAPLRAITLIKRSKENRITQISPQEYFSELARQFYLPRNLESKLKTFDIVDRILSDVPIYLLECDISREAAELSFDTLTNE